MADLNENKLITLGNLRKYDELIKEWVKTDSYEEVEYSKLKSLKDSSNLTPGKIYRLIDYEFISPYTDNTIVSGGHRFDLLLQACSENSLFEQCKAIQSLSDVEGYFTNSALECWEVWYDLDGYDENDKGCIHRMIDEFHNECYYDFKNLKYQLNSVLSFFDNEDEKNKWKSNVLGITEIPDDFYAYTFTYLDENLNLYDASIEFNKGVELITNVRNGCSENHISVMISYAYFYFNKAIFINSHYAAMNNEKRMLCVNNVIKGNYEYGLLFGNDATMNRLDGGYNLIGNGARANYFCYSYNNYLGENCRDNYFEMNVYNNILGNSCSRNTFGSYVINCDFGNSFRQNTLNGQNNKVKFLEGGYNNFTLHNGVSNVTFSGTPSGSTSYGVYVHNQNYGNNTINLPRNNENTDFLYVGKYDNEIMIYSQDEIASLSRGCTEEEIGGIF